MMKREWWRNRLKDSRKYRKLLPLLILLFIPGGTIVAGIWFVVWSIRDSDRMADSKMSFAEFCGRRREESKLSLSPQVRP